MFGVRPSRRLCLLLAGVLSVVMTFGGDVRAAADTPAPPGGSGTGVVAADSDGDGLPDARGMQAALAAADESGVDVEDLSQRTGQVRVVVHPDSTVEMESHAAPLWVQDADGKWVDVDYRLVARPGGGYVPKASPSSVVIDGGGSREFARLDLPGGGSTLWSWPEPLPTPSVEGATATYRVASGVDLLVTATILGVSTRIRINSPEAVAPSFTVSVRTEGVGLSQTDEGQLVFADGDDATGHTASLLAWDARRDRWGDPVEMVPVEASVEETASKGERTDQDITLTTPLELVENPQVVYPITVDPDLSPLSPSQDTWVRRETTSIENGYRLMTGRLDGSPNDNPTISYVQWPNNQISGRKILSANLYLFQYAAGSCSKRTMNIHPLGAAWSDATTVYSNKPSAMTTTGTSSTLTTNVGGQGCGTANGYVSADITKIVQAWAYGAAGGGFGNNGIQLNAPSDNASDVSYERRFCSVNPDPTHTSCVSTAQTPYLSMRYIPDPLVPTSLVLANSASSSPSVSTGADNRLAITPALAAGYSCEQQTACVYGEFTVTRDSDAAVILDRKPSRSVGSSGGALSDIAVNGLVDGKYTVKVRTVWIIDQWITSYSDYASFSFEVDRAPAAPTWSWISPANWNNTTGALPAKRDLQISASPASDDIRNGKTDIVAYCVYDNGVQKLFTQRADGCIPATGLTNVLNVGQFSLGTHSISVSAVDKWSIGPARSDSPSDRTFTFA
jgi:hypothetical protein